MEKKQTTATYLPQQAEREEPQADALLALTQKEDKPQGIVLSGAQMHQMADVWAARIQESEKAYKPYYEMIQKARQAYKTEQKSIGSLTIPAKSAYNIFWSGIETQKPFLYFKRPKPYLERVNKIASATEQVACKMLERALEWDLTQFDFDSMAKYVRNDYLISGCGILWENYCPTFKSIQLSTDDSAELEVKDRELVVSNYIDPQYFLADTRHVGIWEDVTWIAKKIFMRRAEVLEQFGAEVLERLDMEAEQTQEELDKSVCVYEIWDKTTKRVYWITLEGPAQILKILDDPLKLNGFFPCPKPIFATMTNDSLIPVPDFAMIQQMLDELTGITERMRLTMQALKISGVYDNSFHKLADIFEKEVTLVSLPDFDKLKTAGGIKGVIDFVPIEQYVMALEALALRRDDLVNRIFEITGVSDIMRGNSNQVETATAVTKKTNFGTLRNQDRQNDMQRFICDLYRIKAEIICEHFAPETLIGFLNGEEKNEPALIENAVMLLKNEKMRGMLLHVETDGILNAEQDAAKTIASVETIKKLIADGMNVISTQPLLLPLYRQMILAVIGVTPNARLFEGVLDRTFADIEKDLNKPSTSEAVPEMSFIERLNNKRMTMEYDIEKEKNALKARELDIKESEARAKIAVTEKEMALDYQMKKGESSGKNNRQEGKLAPVRPLKVSIPPSPVISTVPIAAEVSPFKAYGGFSPLASDI